MTSITMKFSGVFLLIYMIMLEKVFKKLSKAVFIRGQKLEAAQHPRKIKDSKKTHNNFFSPNHYWNNAVEISLISL